MPAQKESSLTPVMPTSMPTANSESEYSGSIIAGALMQINYTRGDQIIAAHGDYRNELGSSIGGILDGLRFAKRS